MSLLGALSNAASGLAVAQHALDVTANNIGNVNTEGYSRELVRQEAVIIDGRGAGARALDPGRAVDGFLQARALEQASRVGRSEALSGFHGRVQGSGVLGAPGDADRGVAARLGRLASAAEALAADPGRSSQAQAFVGAAQDLARGLGDAAGEVQALRREADQSLAQEVAAANREILALHQLNLEIVRSGPDAGLLDRRDGLLRSLATRIDLAVSDGENGTVAVHTRSGQPLLDGVPRQLVYAPAASVAEGSGFGALRSYRADELDPSTGVPLPGASGSVLVSAGVRAELTPELAADVVPDGEQAIVSLVRGGRMAGLLEARDRTLPALADQLGELAGMVRRALDAAHNRAVPRPPPEALVGSRTDTTAYAGAARAGTAYLAVVDRGTGAVAATVAVNLAAAGSPVAVAAQIAAGLGAYGSAAVDANGALTVAAAGGYGLAWSEGDGTIAVTDATGTTRSFGLADYFGLNDLFTGSGSRTIPFAVRADIAADSSRLGRARLDVTPGPPPTATLGGSGDGRGAAGLAAAFDATTAAAARGGLASGGYRLADYAAEIVAAAALAASGAESVAAADRALADDLAARQASVSGVNLDEELSRLVLYQQAYAVSARVVAITSDLFDQLLAIGR